MDVPIVYRRGNCDVGATSGLALDTTVREVNVYYFTSFITSKLYRSLGPVRVRLSESAKRSFCRAENAVFAKIVRVASEEVTVLLITSKCLPVVYWEAGSSTIIHVRICSLSILSLIARIYTVNHKKT